MITIEREANAIAIVTDKLSAAENLQGFAVEFDPEEAELAGVFEEDALNEEDALESSIDEMGLG